MLKGATARRYAEAAFELAVEQNALDRWLEDLRLIADYFGDHRLQFILNEPNIQLDRKELVVRDLLTSKVQRDALGLALLLVERGLVELAPLIFQNYIQRYNDYKNQVNATVITALPLDPDTRDRVKSELHDITGKTILLEEKVDPSILGGAMARVGDTLIDGSVRRRLKLLRDQIVRGGGSFGGPSDGRPVSGDGSDGGGNAPFAVTPSDQSRANGSGPDGSGANGNPPAIQGDGTGPATSNEVAPRDTQAPHLAPQQRTPGQSTAQQGNDRRGKRNKGRRR